LAEALEANRLAPLADSLENKDLEIKLKTFWREVHYKKSAFCSSVFKYQSYLDNNMQEEF